MKVHMARSETKLVDRNENNKHKHGTIVRSSSEGNRKENAIMWQKEDKLKTTKQGRDRNEGRKKVEGRGAQKTKGRRGSRRGKERTRSARKY